MRTLLTEDSKHIMPRILETEMAQDMTGFVTAFQIYERGHHEKHSEHNYSHNNG
jgi:hypothetical protein